MSQRDSGYERKERDLYETPAWVTEALLPHLRECRIIWEPAAGSGKMSRVLKGFAGTVISSDIAEGQDFLAADGFDGDAIITNPPYGQSGKLAAEFIERALSLTASDRLVAMLLRSDFDHAKSRQHLFQHPAFSKKLVLTKRVKWFEGPTICKHCGGCGSIRGLKCKPCKGKGWKKQGPSENHAWFVWDYRHKGPPTLAYGP